MRGKWKKEKKEDNDITGRKSMRGKLKVKREEKYLMSILLLCGSL